MADEHLPSDQRWKGKAPATDARAESSTAVHGSLASTSAASERSDITESANQPDPPVSKGKGETVPDETPVLWSAYFFAVVLPVIWLFTSYLASSTFLANVKISETGTTGNLFNTTGGLGPSNITATEQEPLAWGSMLPNSLYGALFPILAMVSDRTNAYTFAVTGNLLTLTASILFAVKRTPSSVRTARILMSVGESFLLPQGLKFAGYHSNRFTWANRLAMHLYTFANVELNVIGMVSSTLLLEHPDASMYICIGTSGTSLIMLLARIPLLGFSSQWWRFWVPFYEFFRPMILLGAAEQTAVDKILNTLDLLDEEEEHIRQARFPTAALLLYAPRWYRLSFWRFDYFSALLIGASLFFFGFVFGALAFTGVGLSGQAKNLSAFFHHLAVYFFVGAICAFLCGVSAHYFRKRSHTTFFPPESFKSQGQITFVNTKFIHDDYHDAALPTQTRPGGGVEGNAAVESAQNDAGTFLQRNRTFRSMLSALLALLASMTAFYAGISVFITLLDAMGHDKSPFSLTIFVFPVSSLVFNLIVNCNAVKRQFTRLIAGLKGLIAKSSRLETQINRLTPLKEILKEFLNVSGYPRYYLSAFHLLNACSSMIMSQISASTFDSPKLISFFLSSWSAGVSSTFTYLIYAVSDEYKCTVALPTAALDFVVQLAFVVSLALSRVFASSVVTPKKASTPSFPFFTGHRHQTVAVEVIDNAQRSLGLIMALQLVAAMIIFGGVHVGEEVKNASGSDNEQLPDPQQGDIELETLQSTSGRRDLAESQPLRPIAGPSGSSPVTPASRLSKQTSQSKATLPGVGATPVVETV